jgi:hypothetical protein
MGANDLPMLMHHKATIQSVSQSKGTQMGMVEVVLAEVGIGHPVLSHIIQISFIQSMPAHFL